MLDLWNYLVGPLDFFDKLADAWDLSTNFIDKLHRIYEMCPMTIMLMHRNSILFTVSHVYYQGFLSIPAYNLTSYSKYHPE